MSIKYQALANCVMSLHAAHKNDPAERAMAINMIRNGIFDCPAIFSGLVSEKGQHLKVSELTKEHFYPRQASAHKMFAMLDAGATADDLIDYIKTVCQVHYVTKEENEALRQYQKIGSGYNTPEEQYGAVPVNLVPYVRKKPVRKQKYIYTIYGVVYNSKSEAAAAHNCSEQDVYYRCVTSTSKKWFEWKRKKIDNE